MPFFPKNRTVLVIVPSTSGRAKNLWVCSVLSTFNTEVLKRRVLRKPFLQLGHFASRTPAFKSPTPKPALKDSDVLVELHPSQDNAKLSLRLRQGPGFCDGGCRVWCFSIVDLEKMSALTS